VNGIKFSLCFNWTPSHAGLSREWWYSFTPRPFYPQGKSSWYRLDRRLGGPQSRSRHGGEEKNSQPLPGLEPPIIELVTQLCTIELTRLPVNGINYGTLYPIICSVLLFFVLFLRQNEYLEVLCDSLGGWSLHRQALAAGAFNSYLFSVYFKLRKMPALIQVLKLDKCIVKCSLH
jgi:hypothetical protein